jgi:putative hemolysin
MPLRTIGGMQGHAHTPRDRDIIDASRSIIARNAIGLPHETAGPARLEAVWARDDDELRAAQALRWRVFVQEMGATITPPRGTPAGLDADLFDPYCEHLLVRTVPSAGEAAQVVGTYRVLTPAAARRVGGLYSESVSCVRRSLK